MIKGTPTYLPIGWSNDVHKLCFSALIGLKLSYKINGMSVTPFSFICFTFWSYVFENYTKCVRLPKYCALFQINNKVHKSSRTRLLLSQKFSIEILLGASWVLSWRGRKKSCLWVCGRQKPRLFPLPYVEKAYIYV